MAKNKIKITPEMEAMMDNFHVNFSHEPMPPLSWFALSDDERARANDAPVTWRYGILPPKEFREFIDSID
ncbi:hypothetical protein [Adlercreutzia agrestimuris]|uniref:hypothetical protein n=1 Tax=Adlercreutzia agrestimuris TaxID=2941324 RepID=UPI00203B1D4C|nr:hypothetical protein [Adlercreutzia agrestimuris]